MWDTECVVCVPCCLQLAPSEDFNTATLTTNSGAPVDDTEHSMTVGDKGGWHMPHARPARDH